MVHINEQDAIHQKLAAATKGKMPCVVGIDESEGISVMFDKE